VRHMGGKTAGMGVLIVVWGFLGDLAGLGEIQSIEA
jgi:hypothetical protein